MGIGNSSMCCLVIVERADHRTLWGITWKHWKKNRVSQSCYINWVGMNIVVWNIGVRAISCNGIFLSQALYFGQNAFFFHLAQVTLMGGDPTDKKNGTSNSNKLKLVHRVDFWCVCLCVIFLFIFGGNYLFFVLASSFGLTIYRTHCLVSNACDGNTSL